MKPSYAWVPKAAVQASCSLLPRGDSLYRRIQSRFGRLQGDPFTRIDHARRLAESASRAGRPVQGAEVIEVGTGHVPAVPVFLSLLGAKRVVTVDLHPRLEPPMLARACGIIADCEEQVVRELGAVIADEGRFRSRIRGLRKHLDAGGDPLEVLSVEYRSPVDARSLPFGAATFDLCCSVTTLEHIPPDSLLAILRDEVRVLRPNGLAVHLVDLADHYATQDAVSSVNFLTVNEFVWRVLANNRFAYCNRLRASEVLELFAAAGLDPVDVSVHVDEAALRGLDRDRLSERWRAWDPTDLCTTEVNVAARARGSSADG